MDKLGIGNETQYAHTAKAKAKDLGRRANGKDQARKVMKKTPRETAPKVIKQGSTDDPAAPLDEPLDTAQQTDAGGRGHEVDAAEPWRD